MQDGVKTLVRGGSGGASDAKVACETLLNVDPPPGFPAESFYVSKEDEYDWYDRNSVYERNESLKGNSTQIPHFGNLNAHISHSNPNSQRFSSNLLSKASVILGLPKQHNSSCFKDGKIRRNVKPGNARFFPKRSGSDGKRSVRVGEPSSPKVSCIGRVRSKKNRSRNNRNRPELFDTTKPAKTGLWSSFKEVLYSCRKNHAVDVKEASKKNSKAPPVQGDNQANQPGLGGLNRFVSGRRSDSWAGDALDLEKAV
ncbi:hypothetical protein IFM89_031053 [Coptis chinensis]|uniref:Uncharacterized protein n=1 Tax=Coptis chinensis TaxID=261450 RepID=A0A835H720_9MAGN|nr:hypothetical protein IFM89_031053 [Coptis chinensis]